VISLGYHGDVMKNLLIGIYYYIVWIILILGWYNNIIFIYIYTQIIMIFPSHSLYSHIVLVIYIYIKWDILRNLDILVIYG
jgi:hypothetical protein